MNRLNIANIPRIAGGSWESAAHEPLRLLNYWYRERGSIAKEAYDEIKHALESNATLQPAALQAAIEKAIDEANHFATLEESQIESRAAEAKQIAEETADKIYERYINEKQWTKSGTLTQGEFLAMMREHIQAAIEKALSGQRIYGEWGTAVVIDDEFSSVKGRAERASEKKRCKCGNAIYTGDVCEQCLRESRTARASEKTK